jgi:HlyD family secretion protein
MPVSISVGALPGAAGPRRAVSHLPEGAVDGTATVFPVEIALAALDEIRLRAGFSANAEIIMDERADVLLLPERVVTFEGETAWVEVPGPGGAREKRTVRTGLSDAIRVEVLRPGGGRRGPGEAAAHRGGRG